MLCLIVAYKSHRRDQWLESFVWGRPLVTTSVKIAGAQHRHLRRGAAVSATTGRVGSGSLSNGSCARIRGNQSDFPQKPTAKEYRKQKTCKQPWTNQRCILHIDWMSLSFRMLVLPLRRFCVFEGLKIHKLKNTTCLEDSPSTPSLTGTVLVAGSMACPSNMWNRNRFGILTLMPSTQAATQQKEAKFVRIGYTKNLPGHANQIRSTWHQMKRTMPLFGCQLPHMLSSIWCDIFGNDSSCVSTELTFDRRNLPPWCWWQLHAKIDIRWSEISSRAGFRVLHKMVVQRPFPDPYRLETPTW